jgi:tRNA-splicing ligase RtcB (3'-phosphate/5'-hydroxy nucleic acid ligase)
MSTLTINKFEKNNDFEWELPRDYRSDMRVPVRIFASRDLLEQSLQDKSIIQAINASTLPGLVEAVMVMPDMHQGYGFPIGGVAAFDLEKGIVSPGGIGYDINCGVRLLSSEISVESVENKMADLADMINSLCPSGVGVDSDISLSENELTEACTKGLRWAFKKGFATEMDITHTEENGCLQGADPDKLSRRAIERGRKQLGTLGGGNHFIEVDEVVEIFNPDAAKAMNLSKGTWLFKFIQDQEVLDIRSALITCGHCRQL